MPAKRKATEAFKECIESNLKMKRLITCTTDTNKSAARVNSSTARINDGISTAKIATAPQSVASASMASRPQPQAQLATKRGSYKDVMARARAGESRAMDFGKIVHKKLDASPRRTRVLKEAGSEGPLAKKKHRPDPLGKQDDRNRVMKPSLTTKSARTAPVRRAQQLEYTGTIRPGSDGRTGASAILNKQTHGGQHHLHSGRGHDRSSGRYRYASESSEAEDSDMSNDMEGGGFDELEREEKESLRVARQEDARELKHESDHKQAKEERRRRLLELAKKAK